MSSRKKVILINTKEDHKKWREELLKQPGNRAWRRKNKIKYGQRIEKNRVNK